MHRRRADGVRISVSRMIEGPPRVCDCNEQQRASIDDAFDVRLLFILFYILAAF